MPPDYENYYSELTGTSEFNEYWRQGHLLTTWGLATSVGVEECLKNEQFDNERGDEVIEFLHQSALCRAVDNFQSYVVDIIVSAFSRNPDLIFPKKTTKISNIFRFNNLDELRRFAIEEGASDYGYQNVVDIDKDLRSRFGFGILNGRLRRLRLRRIIEIRNMIVHNRARKSHRFVDQIGAKFDRFGDVVRFPHPLNIDDYLHNAAVDIDLIAKKHFGLKAEHE